jgi:hypothetical protein
MSRTRQLAFPILPAQLRRLQALWREWTASLDLPADRDRVLRHYYVERFTDGRAAKTRELDVEDAARVIAWLEKLVRRPTRRQRRAAGTAGRRGYPEQRRVSPNAAAWGALWSTARGLGMDRDRLERFIATHYSGAGLHGLDDLHTMADLNRVLWGLKAMLRRGPRAKPAAKREAA